MYGVRESFVVEKQKARRVLKGVIWWKEEFNGSSLCGILGCSKEAMECLRKSFEKEEVIGRELKLTTPFLTPFRSENFSQ